MSIILSAICLFLSVTQEEKMSLIVADAVDYKGFPADRSKTGGWVPAALVLGLFIIHVLRKRRLKLS